jgi:type I restriction enzyme, S subunit
MTSEARAVPINDAVELIIDHRGRTPKKLGGDFSSTGVQVVSAKNVHGGRVHLDENRRFVPREMAERWMPNKLMPGDVLLTSEAPLGEAAYLDGHTDLCLGQRLFALRARPGVTDRRFLYYALRSPLVQRRLHARATGTTAQGIKQSELRQVELALPPVFEQERIAAALGSLDDKIDSNRRLASLLEEVAAEVFRARFIDFVGVEPLVDSEIGHLPEGWRAGQLKDIAVVHREMVSGESDLPYLGLDAMPRASTVLTDWMTENAPAGQAAVFDTGDVLFGKLRPYFRKVGVAPLAGRCSTEILVLRPVSQEMYGIVLGHVASPAFIEHCVAVSRGTKMPRAEWRDAGSFAIAIPPENEAARHTKVIRTLYQQIRTLIHESRALISVRDALLPKVVSGEIRVAEIADPNPSADILATRGTAATS